MNLLDPVFFSTYQAGAAMSPGDVRNAQIRDAQHCPLCRNFAWASFMRPVCSRRSRRFHHPSCMRVRAQRIADRSYRG
jgi:hypothetical protein